MSDLSRFGGTIKARVAAFKEHLRTNASWALRGLVVLYEHQTADERAAGTTYNLNGVGFTGNDAEILTSFAQQYQERGSLSVRQMSVLHRRMPKYARQLLNIATAKVPA
jgi:hypothetical protein